MSKVRISNRMEGDTRYPHKSEVQAELVTDAGVRFEFILKKHRIKVVPEKLKIKVGSGKQVTVDWHDERAMSEADKVKVFSAILAEYRKRSLGDEEWRGAAIGITEDHQIFIGLNTKRQTDYFKDCAEQNMLNAVTDAEVYEAALKSNGERYEPKPPRLKAVYVMGGREADPNKPGDPGTPVSCVCGKCTDMLANAMDATAPVYTIPIKYAKRGDDLILNEQALTMAELPAGEIWKTSIGHLNAHREISLASDTRAERFQQSGLKATLKYAASKIGVKGWEMPPEIKPTSAVGELGVEEQHQQTVSTILLSATGAMKTWVESVGKESLKFKAFGDVALKAAENALLGRKSIPELDVAVRGGGDVDLKSVNQFMIQHIDEAVASRLRNMIASHSNGEIYANIKKDPKAQQQLLENIQAVRCCVIQLEDGTFHYALETKTRDDNATPNAEVNALSGALERLTEARIKNVWVTELRPEDIAKGSMHLSPKEGVERLVKRGTRRGDMHFNYIPFNSGELSNESLQAVTRQFAANDIFPAAFKGSKYIPGGDDTPAMARLG